MRESGSMAQNDRKVQVYILLLREHFCVQVLENDYFCENVIFTKI